MNAYEKPQIEVVGTLHELTLSGNKIGLHPDVYSSTVPIVGSIIPAS